MKVFIPMSDELLSKQGEMTGRLVPFTSELLQVEILSDKVVSRHREPVNWIVESNYREACSRLQQAN